MSENYLRGKAKNGLRLPDWDEPDTPLLVLLRDLFIEHDAPYNIKELAAELEISVFSVYKMFSADRPLRAETLLAIVRFVNDKNDNDTRLLDFIVGQVGYMAVPKIAGKHVENIRAILMAAADLAKRED